MGAAKPTLGYPSRTDAVIALRRQGLKTPEIARRLGIKEKTAESLWNHGRKAWKRQGAPVAMSRDAAEALEPYAEARGLSVEQLAARLLQVIADEDMVAAVLDDGRAD